MAWIQSHQQLERHPKTHALMSLMGWDAEGCPFQHVALDVTIGKLHRFWYWCLDFAPNGDLRGKNDGLIARSVGLASDDGRRFVDAMVQSGWIDRTNGIFRVHDWPDYAGRYLKESKFRNHPEKLKEMASVYHPRIVHGTSEVDKIRLNRTAGVPGNPEFDDLEGWEFAGLAGHLQTAGFRTLLINFLRNLRETRRAPSAISWRSQLAFLSTLNHDEAMEAVTFALRNNYTGINKNGRDKQRRPYGEAAASKPRRAIAAEGREDN